MDILMSDWIAPVIGIPIPSSWKSSKRKKKAELRNLQTWRTTFYRLMRIAYDRYYIEGLPDTCSQRVSIMSLLWYGRSVFFEREGSIYNLPCVNTSDGFTVMGEWRKCRWVALNGVSDEVNLIIPGGTQYLEETVIGGKPLEDQKGVLIRETPDMLPFILTVIQWTDYITDTLRSLDVARRHLKHPTVIAMPESMVKSTRGLEDSIDDSQDVIGVASMYDSKQIETLNLGTSGITDELRDLYEWYEAQYMGFCGIAHNSGSDKKGENLISDEIGVDEELDNTNLRVCLESIQAGLDLANRKWGLDMHVKSKHLSVPDTGRKKEEKEGEESELV